MKKPASGAGVDKMRRMTIFLAAMLKPFALMLMLLPSIPVTLAVRRWMKDGKLKRLLLDRDLVNRQPGVGWAAFFLCYAVMGGIGWYVFY